MLNHVAEYALQLSWYSFLIFLIVSSIELVVQLSVRLCRRQPVAIRGQDGVQGYTPANLDQLGKSEESFGNAAVNFKKAGPAATAAALAIGCLLIALTAAGLELVPHSAEAKATPEAATDGSSADSKLIARIDTLESTIQPRIKEYVDKLIEKIDQERTSIDEKFDALTQTIRKATPPRPHQVLIQKRVR